MSAPPLIAVVGPVEPPLLEAFITHYEHLGVERFLFALHFPLPTPASVQEPLIEICRRRIGGAQLVAEEPWHESASNRLRDELRDRAGQGWHLLADADEFQCHPGGLATTVRDAEAAGVPVAGGVMLDRVAADGSIDGWSPSDGLDAAYPAGAFLTHSLLRGDPRKIVLVHSSVREVAVGNHRAPGFRPVNAPRVAIHHFKWRAGVVTYLRQRLDKLTAGEWRELSPAPRLEATRFFTHIDTHGGRFDIGDPVLNFRPVTVDRLPDWWAADSQHLVDTWRPPTAPAAKPAAAAGVRSGNS
ncbi:hypothetical protein [Micromonospora sp. KC723]|uniref:hypothetical protein n=1 Tax=Micromonospora sp. KC723 TaxID=2530381 RepID=UPI001A9EDC66|nr:hypothetical protein [Micromonospora sp. KC723]